METGGQAPKYTNDAQCLHALVSVLSPSVLDNGAVLLLPKHRCCAGSCHGVEPRDNKEIREVIEIRENKGIQENRHILEGVWGRAGTGTFFFVIHTVQAKPGYLFGTSLTGDYAKKVIFWFRSDGKFKEILEGKWIGVDSPWVETKLYWNSNNNSVKVVWSTGSSKEYARLQLDEASRLPVLD